jgi:hypothetical protein
MTKRGVLKAVRNIVVSIVVLAVLFIGGGLGYTWYMGQQPSNTTSAIAAPVESQPVPAIKPAKPAANAKESASVQMLTSPIAPGANASITVKTNPASKCTIIVEYNKVASKDSGLVARAADEFGTVSWTWTVDKTAPLGKWPVKVTCTYNKKSAFVQVDLKVAAQ